MRESDNGRDEVFPWSDAPGPPVYAVGDAICNSYQPPSRGTVVSVDAETATMGVKWDDGDGGAIVYPTNATYLRKAMPWE